MANFNVASVDRKLSGIFTASSAQDAAIEAMNLWGSSLQSGVEVQKTKSKPRTLKARKGYKCDCCGCDINKGDEYFKKSRSIGNPNKTSVSGMAIVHHGLRYTAAICVNCK